MLIKFLSLESGSFFEVGACSRLGIKCSLFSASSTSIFQQNSKIIITKHEGEPKENFNCSLKVYLL